MPRLYVTGKVVEEFNSSYEEWIPNKHFEPKTKSNYITWLLEVEWMFEDLD